jgi:hypothetical protein
MAPSSARATTLNRSAATKDAVSLFERYPERGDDQKKEWADKMLPTLRLISRCPRDGGRKNRRKALALVSVAIERSYECPATEIVS